MIFHGVNLLRHISKLEKFVALVAAGAGLIVLVCMLHGVLLGVFFKYFTLFQIVPGPMQQAFIFCTGWRITPMA